MGNMKFFLQVISFHFQVIYCYGDLVPRHGELFEGKEESGNRWISISIIIKIYINFFC